MVDKERTQEKRQDHIQDGQKIFAKDAQVRTAHPIYDQGIHLDRQIKWGHIMVGCHTTGNENVRPAFEAYKGNKEDLPPGYQQIKFHMIFDIKLGKNFRKYAGLVGGGYTKTAPSSLKFSSVVSRDSVRITLTITD